MGDFFNTIYNWTKWLYCQELDNYLYETVPGYYQVGLVVLIVTLLSSIVFYYLLKPVRRQYFWWFVVAGVAAGINFLFGLYYTETPLINNEVDSADSWLTLDCIFFSLSNAMWSFVFFTIFAFIFKWRSTCKYVPF